MWGADEVSNYMRLLARNDDNYAYLANRQEYKDMLKSFEDNDTSKVAQEAKSSSSEGDDGGAGEEVVWLQCAMCGAWRRVPGGGEALDENLLCTDNPDPKYNECGVEQELTNEQIDADCGFV